MIFKKLYIQIKNVYGYKLLRAVKRFELKRCSKQYRRNHRKQCKLFTSKKKRILTGSIMQLNDLKHFGWRFLLTLQHLFLIVFIVCLNFCILSLFEIIRCIVKSLIATSTYLFVEIQLKTELWKEVFFGCQDVGNQTSTLVSWTAWICHLL